MEAKTPKKLRTGAEVREEFLRSGRSVASWARAHGFEVRLVHEVLSGRKRGVRGDCHKIAVLLGMKAGVIVEDGADPVSVPVETVAGDGVSVAVKRERWVA